MLWMIDVRVLVVGQGRCNVLRRKPCKGQHRAMSSLICIENSANKHSRMPPRHVYDICIFKEREKTFRLSSRKVIREAKQGGHGYSVLQAQNFTTMNCPEVKLLNPFTLNGSFYLGGHVSACQEPVFGPPSSPFWSRSNPILRVFVLRATPPMTPNVCPLTGAFLAPLSAPQMRSRIKTMNGM